MARLIRNILLSLIICCYGFLDISAKREVNVKNGQIMGEVLLNWDQNEYYSFKSIPYAKPPLGELRFKAPVQAEPWVGILNASKPSPMCPQFYYEELVGQEDCLYLNVYTPTLDAKAKLPVMVYIHGGGYYVGSGSSSVYGPEFLLTQQIVLVTFDYRLGYLGSLSFKDQTQGVPGNAHMKDQVLALQWVKENIKHFGGNENLVTVFGESVGGASVHMHMLSPLSQGLVHRVIAQSGCALNSWNRGVLGTGDVIAGKLGKTGSNTQETIKKLQDMPMEEFIRKTQKAGELSVAVNKFMPHSPVLETQTNEPAFLPKYPAYLIAEAPNKVPMMLGYNNNDSLIVQVMRRLYQGTSLSFPDLAETIPWDINIPNDEERLKVVQSIKTTFFPNKSENENLNIGKVSQYALGPWDINGKIQAIEKHLKLNHDIYFYKFSTDTRLNFLKRLHPLTAMYKGASHMDELGHLFTTEHTPCFAKNSAEDIGWRTLVKTWTDFARHGNPTPDNKPLKWNKVTDVKNIVYVDINGGKLEEHHEPDKIVFDFWRNLYEKYNKISF